MLVGSFGALYVVGQLRASITESGIVTQPTEAFAHCSDLVRRRDEDRWLSANYAPRAQRNALLALYALHLEVARVPSLVSEAPLGEIRLQWWREAVDEIAEGKSPRAHPVAQALGAAALVENRTRDAVDAGLNARARLLYGEDFTSADDFVNWARAAEAFLAPIAARRLDPALNDEALQAVTNAALAYALVRHGPGLAPALADDLRLRARELYLEARPSLCGLPAAAMPAVAHFALTPRYARERPPSPLRKRIAVFASIARGRI